MPFRYLAGLAVVTLCLAILSPTIRVASSQTGRCGSWRWSVKTLSDPKASKVNFNPVGRTVQLHALNPPDNLKTSTPRTAPIETQVFRVRARLMEYTREADHDFHIVVAAPNDSSKTMVAEVVDPACPGAEHLCYYRVLAITSELR